MMASVSEEQKNARRKAMLLLEHMDRTEKGLSMCGLEYPR